VSYVGKTLRKRLLTEGMASVVPLYFYAQEANKLMNTRLLPLCAALLAALPLAAPAQTRPASTAPPLALRYKWTPGEVLRYKMTMDSNMAMTMTGQGPNVPRAIPALATHMVMAYDLAVQSVNPADGAATLTEHITQMTGTLNGQHIPGLDAAANAYKGGFTVVMSPTGKMLSVQMPPAVNGHLPPGMDFSKLGNMTPAMLPSFPARVGDTWQDNTAMHLFDQMPGMPTLQMTVFSSLAGISTDAHPIAGIHQEYQGTLGGAVPAGTAAKVDMTGQFHGDNLVKFDVDNGSVAAQDGTMTMNANVAVPKPPASARAMQMQMHVQMTTHLERLPGAS